VFLWPDCVDAFEAWIGIQTQWRKDGMGGATGLDYSGVGAYLSEHGFKTGSARRREAFECLQAAERATLEVWAEQRANEASNPPPQPQRPPGL
jgi:hypothetical protein